MPKKATISIEADVKLLNNGIAKFVSWCQKEIALINIRFPGCASLRISNVDGVCPMVIAEFRWRNLPFAEACLYLISDRVRLLKKSLPGFSFKAKDLGSVYELDPDDLRHSELGALLPEMIACDVCGALDKLLSLSLVDPSILKLADSLRVALRHFSQGLP